MQEESFEFEAEVGRVLNLVVHSLYSNEEIFLRELISNAADACDRLRYLAITEPALLGPDAAFAITIRADRGARTLSIADNGIGMSRDELKQNLGTIARSGSAAFLSSLTGDAKKDLHLIGQFGVGFYAAFMVADDVEVVSRRAGETLAHVWRSKGDGKFTIAPAEKAGRGTEIILHLRKDADAFLDPHRLKAIVKTYSDHIAVPIRLEEEPGKAETINSASALWTRPKKDIEPQQYREFYHHVAHAFDDPWLTLHLRAEGAIEYTALLFIPSVRPFDLFEPDRPCRLKLYVKRVFITDDCRDLLPSWLRFARGIVDSEDLPLNVSRQVLQESPVVAKIRANLTNRILADLADKARCAPDEYATFWNAFGAVLKEGLYEAPERRDALLPLLRFQTTGSDGLVDLGQYVSRMRPGQEHIYVLSGESAEAVARSPHLEGFKARGVEVLLLTDPIDEFWPPAIGAHEGKTFRSITRGAADLEKIPLIDEGAAPPAAAEGALAPLIALFKLALGDAVKDVRSSARLTESPVCLVADEADPDLRLEKLLKHAQRLDVASKRVLEINPRHPLVLRLAEAAAVAGNKDRIGDIARLLLDQARISEGEPLPDPQAFGKRLAGALEASLERA